MVGALGHNSASQMACTLALMMEKQMGDALAPVMVKLTAQVSVSL